MKNNTIYEVKKTVCYPNQPIRWGDNIYISMSINNNVFNSDDTLAEFIKFLSAHSKNITIINGGFLHRYNEQIFFGLSEHASAKVSLEKGSLLQKKFIDTVKKIDVSINYKFIDSLEFNKYPTFHTKFKLFQSFYISESKFRYLLEYTIDVFLRRQPEIKLSATEARKRCLMYLIEELVIFEILAEKGYYVNVYPGNQLPIIKAICMGKLKNISNSLEHIQAVEVKFRPKK